MCDTRRLLTLVKFDRFFIPSLRILIRTRAPFKAHTFSLYLSFPFTLAHSAYGRGCIIKLLCFCLERSMRIIHGHITTHTNATRLFLACTFFLFFFMDVAALSRGLIVRDHKRIAPTFNIQTTKQKEKQFSVCLHACVCACFAV